MTSTKKLIAAFSAALIFIASCTEKSESNSGLPETILNDPNSYFYVDVKNYPAKDKSLPIGVFDSGTGGLTVLDAIVNFDQFNNTSLCETYYSLLWYSSIVSACQNLRRG